MARLVLTDASPLIGLSIVGGLPWLKDLFGEVWMPIEVEREVLSGRVSRGEDEIRSAVADRWFRIFERTPREPDFPDLGFWDEERTASHSRYSLAHVAITTTCCSI